MALAALPLRDQTGGHVEIAREHTLADASTLADGRDFLRRQDLEFRQTRKVEPMHGRLIDQYRLVDGTQSITAMPALLRHHTSPRVQRAFVDDVYSAAHYSARRARMPTPIGIGRLGAWARL